MYGALHIHEQCNMTRWGSHPAKGSLSTKRCLCHSIDNTTLFTAVKAAGQLYRQPPTHPVNKTPDAPTDTCALVHMYTGDGQHRQRWCDRGYGVATQQRLTATAVNFVVLYHSELCQATIGCSLWRQKACSSVADWQVARHYTGQGSHPQRNFQNFL